MNRHNVNIKKDKHIYSTEMNTYDVVQNIII